MSLELYIDPMSQPSRAIMMLLKEENIEHKLNNVYISKGQHKKPEFMQNINPIGRLPVMKDGDYLLTESCTILRYICTKFKVADHWYGGSDLKKQSRINEFLDWYQTGIRRSSTDLMQGKFLPLMTKQDLNQPKFQALATAGAKSLQQNLRIMTSVWLQDGKKKYLCGDEISVADLIAATEITQIAVTGESIDQQKLIIEWLERVRANVKSFDAVSSVLYTVIQRGKKQSYIKLPSKM